MDERWVHVVPYSGHWLVRQHGSLRALRRYPTEAEAVGHGERLAREARTRLFLHRRDGMVARDVDFSGHDAEGSARITA